MAVKCSKNTWDNPLTGRKWRECGNCRGVVSKKAEACRHCGSVFIKAQDKNWLR